MNPALDVFIQLSHCEIDLFILHAKQEGNMMEWDRLENDVVKLGPKKHDFVAYFLVQVVATRLRCIGTAKESFMDYVKLLSDPSAPTKVQAVRPSMSLAVFDLFHEFKRAQQDTRGDWCLQQAFVLTTDTATAVRTHSCHTDLAFRRLIYNEDTSRVKEMLADFECRDLLVEHYGLCPGSWFERDRLTQALRPFKDDGSWDLQTLLSRNTVSPAAAKVRRSMSLCCVNFVIRR